MEYISKTQAIELVEKLRLSRFEEENAVELDEIFAMINHAIIELEASSISVPKPSRAITNYIAFKKGFDTKVVQDRLVIQWG